ncbi:MAG: hypothetical protein ABH812_01270 [bacterium]
MFKLPFSLFNKKNSEKDNYLGLLLKESEGVIFLLRLNDSSSSIIAKERFTFTNGWDNLAEDIDEVLYRLELKGYKSPNKSIFFVYSNLVDKYNKEIKREYLDKVKGVVKNLELKPLGYIEVRDAVVDLIVTKEGVAISALLIEISNSSISVFFYKNGKLLCTETAEKKDDIIESLSPIFEKMKVENMLPSRMLIYDSKNLDREMSSILSHSWEKDLFIHHPKVEMVNEGELTDSLINVFSKQLLSKNVPVEQEIKKADVMGFVIGDDINKNKDNAPLESSVEVEKFDKSFADKPKEFFGNYYFKIKQAFNKGFSNVKNIKYSKNIFAIIGIVLIFLSFFLIEYFFHKTEITLTLPSQTIEKVIVIEDIKPDISTKSASFTSSEKTTGKKDVGEKAKGEVTINNFDSSEIKFDSRTELTNNSLIFLLDSDTKVASASLTSDSSAKLPGKTKAKVSALKIGPDYNISANNKFSIANYPDIDYFAINEEPILGGSKKEVRTVSEDDISSLDADILKQAKQYSKDKIDSNFKKTHLIVDKLGGIELTNLNYDKEQGEETDLVTLKAKANITYVGLNHDKVKSEILEKLKNEVEKNYVIEKSNISYLVQDAQKEQNTYVFDIDVSAKASEKVDLSNVRSSIVRKNINNIDNIVKDEYKAKKVEINISNPIPFFRSWTSIFKNNISLHVIYD